MHIKSIETVLGNEMYNIIIFTEEGCTIDDLIERSQYSKYIPYKHKKGKSFINGEKYEYLSFWINQETKEKYEEQGLLDLMFFQKKWN